MQASTAEQGPDADSEEVEGLALELNPGPAGFFYSKKETEELDLTKVNSTLQSFQVKML